MIKAKNIYYSYDDLEVLKGISLDIKKGDFVSITGSSGAGKTTLLQLLGTLEKIQQGSLTINNIEINQLTEKELSAFRNQEIGFVFQFHNLLNEFSAIENICLPAFLMGKNRNESSKKALELLNILNLKNKENHKVNELSGGEQQRVAVARALINSPAIVLADEPSGNLDSYNAENLHKLFLKINKELGQTVIVSTHNRYLANYANKNIKIKDGKLI